MIWIITEGVTIAVSDGEEGVKIDGVSLAERNYRNMIHFFREELRRIHQGEKASRYLNDYQRRKLTDLGILERNYGYGGCRLLVSEKARRLLNLEG